MTLREALDEKKRLNREPTKHNIGTNLNNTGRELDTSAAKKDMITRKSGLKAAIDKANGNSVQHELTQNKDIGSGRKETKEEKLKRLLDRLQKQTDQKLNAALEELHKNSPGFWTHEGKKTSDLEEKLRADIQAECDRIAKNIRENIDDYV